jgi:hypothetical protein
MLAEWEMGQHNVRHAHAKGSQTLPIERVMLWFYATIFNEPTKLVIHLSHE